MHQSIYLPVLLTIISLLITGQLKADETIYKWTDDQGVIHFSDTKTSGAEEVNVELSPGIEMAKPAPRRTDTKPATKQKFGIEISSPSHEETIRSNEGQVVVQSVVKPEWNSSLLVQVLIDGIATAEPSPNTTFVLEGIERGEHKIQLKLFDSRSNILATSGSTTIYVHKASVYGPGGNDVGVSVPAE